MRGHACHSRGTGREGDADAYGRIDMHVVCRGLASFGRSRTDGPKGASHACPVASARGVRHDCRVGVMRRCALRNELDDELAVRLREREREAARLHARPGRRACGAVGRRAAGRIELSYVRPLAPHGHGSTCVCRRRARPGSCAPRQPGQERGRVVRARDRPNGQGQTMRDDARS